MVPFVAARAAVIPLRDGRPHDLSALTFAKRCKNWKGGITKSELIPPFRSVFKARTLSQLSSRHWVYENRILVNVYMLNIRQNKAPYFSSSNYTSQYFIQILRIGKHWNNRRTFRNTKAGRRNAPTRPRVWIGIHHYESQTPLKPLFVER